MMMQCTSALQCMSEHIKYEKLPKIHLLFLKQHECEIPLEVSRDYNTELQ